MADKGCKAQLLAYAQLGLARAKREKAETPADAKRCAEHLSGATERWKQAKRNLRKGPCSPAVDNIIQGFFHWQSYEDCTGRK